MPRKRPGFVTQFQSRILTTLILGSLLVITGCDRTAEPPTGSEDELAGAEAVSPCPSGMVEIPSGSFLMGSEEGDADEKPVHQVTVDAFCIDRTEVTVAMYAECVRSSECSPAWTTADWPGIDEAAKNIDSQFCNGERPELEDHALNCVDWHQADAYCRAAGKRLPTEEEWEYAARGTDGRKYPWGNGAPSANLLNGCGDEFVALGARLGMTWGSMYDGDDGWESTAPVGSYPAGASPFGVLDMAGNVWEWTSSRYSPDYGSSREDERYVMRGGAWGYENPDFVRTANRGKSPRVYRGADLGFRCAADPVAGP